MSSWALVIKLCDRLDNIIDLNNSSKEFKEKYISETIEIIDFITSNRKLSNTHLNIIKHILNQIELTNNLNYNQNTKIKSILRLI